MKLKESLKLIMVLLVVGGAMFAFFWFTNSKGVLSDGIIGFINYTIFKGRL